MTSTEETLRLAIFKCHPHARTPHRQTAGSAGYDIHACLDNPVTMNPGERVSVPTGIQVDIPPGFVLSVRPRSGLAINHGVTLINSPGTIDPDFRGEVKILMVNLGADPFTICHGDRIAQALLEKVYAIDWHETTQLERTARGEQGFGSTGK